MHALAPAASHLTSPSTPLDLEVVVPALNEQARIGQTLQALVRQLADLPVTAGVVVVDNGSTDRTLELVDTLSGNGIPVRVVGCSARGKGAAVRRGVLTSTAVHVGFCDADLATPVEHIVQALDLLLQGHRMVAGSRRVEGAVFETRQPLLRRVASRAFHLATQDVSGGMADTQCGFKFFSNELAQVLFRDVQASGWTFDLELVARARSLGVGVVELPVVWSDQAGSSLRLGRDAPRIAREIVAVRRLAAALPSPA